MTRKRSLTLAAAFLFGALSQLQHSVADEAKPAAVTAETEVADVDAAKASELLKSEKPPVVLDIRTPGEFAAGHISGATNVDFYAENFAEQLARLDRSTPYLLHCRSGRRTSESLATFKKLGFKKIYHLTPGMKGWVAAGLPTEKISDQ